MRSSTPLLRAWYFRTTSSFSGKEATADEDTNVYREVYTFARIAASSYG
jgi:hypothetical protein